MKLVVLEHLKKTAEKAKNYTLDLFSTFVTTTTEAIEEIETAKADKQHTHTKDEITDFPDWAKQDSKPSYTASEVDAAPSSHTTTSIASSDGAHSLRYYNGKLQYKDGDAWKTLSIADLLI